MKRIFLLVFFVAMGLSAAESQTAGGITPEMLDTIRKFYLDRPEDRALRNAICSNDIRKLAVNQTNQGEMDTYFSHRVPSKGITDQQQSGRCWLFSGLNVLRARMIAQYDLGEFEFSQNYCFFWDQLEKANLFLQGVIDTREKPREDQLVDWLFRHPLSDGGQFTGISDIVGKYGLVPKEVIPESYSSEHTAQMAQPRPKATLQHTRVWPCARPARDPPSYPYHYRRQFPVSGTPTTALPVPPVPRRPDVHIP